MNKRLTAWLPMVTLLLVGGGVAAAEREVTLAVHNMTCPVCPVTVRKAIEQVDGVVEVVVDFDRKTAVVRYDDALATVEQLAAASTGAGYPAEVAEAIRP